MSPTIRHDVNLDPRPDRLLGSTRPQPSGPARVAGGDHWRRRPAIHKRFMPLATIAILPAAVARLPFDVIQRVGPLAFFGLADLLVAGCAITAWVE